MAGNRHPFPDASDFSPGIIGSDGATRLRDLLGIIKEGRGSRSQIVECIRLAFFSGRAANQQLKSASNPLIALNENNYGLIQNDLTLSAVGLHVWSAEDEAGAIDRLATHILREMPGPDLLRAINSLHARGEQPDKASLAFELGLLGYSLTATHTDHTRMAAWLREAGVLDGWTIDEERVLQLAGVSVMDMEEWADLDEPQRAFLRSARVAAITRESTVLEVSDIRQDVEAKHGESVWRRRDQFAADVVYPLSDAGWLYRPTHAGRGARQGVTGATAKLLALDVDVLDRQLLDGLPSDVRRGLRRDPGTLRAELDSADKNVAGKALEILAARIAVELGLTGLSLRERATHTGGSEVDLVAERIGWDYARWVVQCKNTTGAAGVEVLTREVGVATVMHANVVLLVSRGGFSRDLLRMVHQVNRRTNLQVALVGGRTLDRYLAAGIRVLVTDLRRQAQATAVAKRDALDGS